MRPPSYPVARSVHCRGRTTPVVGSDRTARRPSWARTEKARHKTKRAPGASTESQAQNTKKTLRSRGGLVHQSCSISQQGRDAHSSLTHQSRPLPRAPYRLRRPELIRPCIRLLGILLGTIPPGNFAGSTSSDLIVISSALRKRFFARSVSTRARSASCCL